MNSKINTHHWVKDSIELENMAFEIMKDLEYNYRLPENLITILIKGIKKFLLNYKMEFDSQIIMCFGKEVEEILSKFDERPIYNTILLLKNALFAALSNTLTLRFSNLKISWKKFILPLLSSQDEKIKLTESQITLWIKDLENYLPIIKFLFNKEVIPNFEKEIKYIILSNLNTSIEIKASLLDQAFDQVLMNTHIKFKTKIAHHWENTKIIIEEYIEDIEEKYIKEHQKSRFLLNPSSHFEHGHFLHSTQYYFAKRYFQNSLNCDKLSILLANKIKRLNLRNITLVGFKGYTGMLLQKTKSLFESTGLKIDYIVVEPLVNDKFSWQFEPDFEKINTNLLIILPITCSCLNYVRIQKYLKTEIENHISEKALNKTEKEKKRWQISKSFINIFLIQDNRLKGVSDTIYLNKEIINSLPIKKNLTNKNIENELSLLYSDFNWERIENNVIYFKEKSILIKDEEYRQSYYTGHTIVKLYSDLMLPEECTSCFPLNDLKNEKNIFLTHDNFETPNLIQDFPNFGKQRIYNENLNSQKSYLDGRDLNFTKLFSSDILKGISHHYGHLKVNGNSYLNYIYGNTFFKQNRYSILKFYDEVLKEIILEKPPTRFIKDIVFITIENKHNSTFLDEIVTYKPKKGLGAISLFKNLRFSKGIVTDVSILRIDSQNEFIDNFMSNYIHLLNNKRTLIIYFEEVFSEGKTFKLLSNYLKHYKNINHEEKELRHGFDYVFSLIDRTPYYTREEILKKLFSKENEIAVVNRFITYFKLNVPILSAAHLGNPLNESVNLLKEMIISSHLDILKKRIGKELPNKIASTLETNKIQNSNNIHLKYYPFESKEGQISEIDFLKHKEVLKNGKIELLKLYVAHEINSILAENIKEGDAKSKLEKIAEKNELVTIIVERIVLRIQETKESFFISTESLETFILSEAEIDVIHDTVIKILSRHPFTYYIKIYESVFKYCLIKLDSLIDEIMEKKEMYILNFFEIRKIKFYIRRLVDLDSSYLISKKFLNFVKYLYEERVPNEYNIIDSLILKIENELDNEIEEFYIKPFLALVKDLKEIINSDLEFAQKLKNLKYYISRLLILDHGDVILQNLSLLNENLKFEIREFHNNTTAIAHLLNLLDDKINGIENENKRLKLKENNINHSLNISDKYAIKEAVINNLIYKLNSINSIPSLFIYSYKELIFKNHYRSIKLEALLNEESLLPKVKTEIEDKNLLAQIKDSYYQITGAIKAENINLINKLKELHKLKFNNYHKEELKIINNNYLSKELRNNLIEIEQRKWLNPYSANSINDYYFENLNNSSSLNANKRDPVIINANKFVEKSMYKDDFLKHSSIRLSISNLLRASTLLLNNKTSELQLDFISGINNILTAITSILQPGVEDHNVIIGSPKSKLGYALCVKYRNESVENNQVSNIYVISSDKETNGAQISKKGLIYKLLNGLFTSKENNFLDSELYEPFFDKLVGEQSLLTGVKINDNWESFNDSYYSNVENFDEYKVKLNPEIFSSLIKLDCKGNNNDSGLRLLSNANMSLFFRLSELNIPVLDEGKCELEGKAVLIITYNDIYTRENYLQFMSNEKVRLLLLIKEEFLNFIQNKVESDAFIELLKKREQVEFAESMEHGISRYFKVINHLLDNKNLDSNKITIIKFINKILYSQFAEISDSNSNLSISSKEPIKYTKKQITDLFMLIMSLPHLDRRTLLKSEYTFDISIDFLDCSESIYRIVLPEIFINMRRHSLDVIGKKKYKIYYSGKSIVFANSFDQATNPSPEIEKERGGKAMCKKILSSNVLWEEQVDSINSMYEVKLTFKDI